MNIIKVNETKDLICFVVYVMLTNWRCCVHVHGVDKCLHRLGIFKTFKITNYKDCQDISASVCIVKNILMKQKLYKEKLFLNKTLLELNLNYMFTFDCKFT